MIVLGRHRRLVQDAWNEQAVRAVIEEIACDAIAQFDPDKFWPAHPSDDWVGDGNASFYYGAAGVIWALDYLRRIGAVDAAMDFRPVLPTLMERTVANLQGRPADYLKHGSLLVGDMGAGLLAMRLAPASDFADLVHARAMANMELPVRELMWGTPGSMVAAVHMADMTREPRWRALFEEQAARLLADLEETPQGPLWRQDLYGTHDCWLGPVHGFAGNVIPLLRGWDWLTPAQQAQVADLVPKALAANAWRSDVGTTWSMKSQRERPPAMCQHCHGAPGMVTTFADAPFASPELDDLLLDGGRFTWAAGPLTKGSNLCHGTGGNGYAFLKLHRRTNDPVWLDRARQFAMTAIVQYRGALLAVGRGRYSLWTGDVGLAIYLWDCITAEPRFPTIDVF
ncbi:LanC-like protein [Bradyrhizobium jicamae]|uniref:lanthionine synthetase C family protein n=1 Tax=Bradyrhizobium jicamae TaxID=280332 RepID=UPI001BA7C52B|nr:LanC-like protein [Bradyrhizobium jicamae]MBR0754107.1 LanC-like protein [Bradyrhizobium jicamae]